MQTRISATKISIALQKHGARNLAGFRLLRSSARIARKAGAWKKVPINWAPDKQWIVPIRTRAARKRAGI